MIGLVVIGIYGYVTRIHVDACSLYSQKLQKESVTLPFSHPSRGTQKYTYTCTVTSVIDQHVSVGIAFDEELQGVSVNGETIDLAPLKAQYDQKRLKDWKRGYPFAFALLKGENTIKITGMDRGGRFGMNLAQKPGYFDYVLMFVFGIVPIVYGVFTLIFPSLVKGMVSLKRRGFSWHMLPIAILAAGIALRLFYLVYIPNDMYQHDMGGHIDNIHYFAQHPLQLPPPDKSLQFPQQPLYYYAAAAVYAVSTSLGFNEHDAIYSVRAMSVVFASAWLVFGLMLVRLYTQRNLLVSLFMAFLAFTPSFVFLGAVVNNDALNALLGMIALYAISAYGFGKSRRFLYLAGAAVLMAMLTKISSVLFAIYFVIVLVALYLIDVPERKRYQREILWFGVGVLFVFGFALLKSYIPADGEFRFVNSRLYGNQVIPVFNLGYFASFRLSDLVMAAQSHVTGPDAIRFSLPTYFYGTMLLGEFDYSTFFKPGTLFMLWSQIVFIAGLIYVAGLGGYVYFYRRLTLMQKLLMVPVAINLLLIIKFLLSYWVVCNSDFRYFTPTFGAVGLLLILGLEKMMLRWEWMAKPVMLTSVVLAAAEVVWMAQLMRLQ